MKKHRRIQALLSLILAFACLSGCGAQVEQPSAAHEQLQSEAALREDIPEYEGEPYVELNGNVPQLPQWEEGKEVSAEDGGSALAVTSQSKNQAAAYKLVEYMTHGEGAQTMADTGTFPSLKKILRSDSFTDPTTESNKKTNDYFGGQNVNEVLSAAAQRPTEKFQYLPYNPYAQTAYGDEVSKAYSGDITLEKALENYANKLAEQGKQQGYNVTVK